MNTTTRQPRHHKWYHMLSFRQPMVPPTKPANWQSVLSGWGDSINISAEATPEATPEAYKRKRLPQNLLYKSHPIRKLKCLSSRLAVVFAQSIEARCWVENEDVVGAAPTGDAPTTSEWSTILLPTKVCLMLDVWRQAYFSRSSGHFWSYWIVWIVPLMSLARSLPEHHVVY